MIDEETFIEQAEYISDTAFKKWTIPHQNEVVIIKKLTQGGAKLITGPRGCGKTTLMLNAYNKLIGSSKAASLPIYVNFKSSLKLEPLYRNTTNAAYWFNQWLLLKVLHGLHISLEYKKTHVLITAPSKIETKKNIDLLEMGRVDLLDNESDRLSISKLENIITNALEETNKQRCVILLDDAAHAFSPEQQHDFFEFFRRIKTKTISPKAAIYPGVTTYSSSFHAGHDAEEINVWKTPNSPGYMDFMKSLLEARLGENLYGQLAANPVLLELLCNSAYGIPRALLNMVNSLCNEDSINESGKMKLDNKKALVEIKNNFDRTYRMYDSLKLKLPMYKKFIDSGADFFEKCLTLNKEFNKGADSNKQSSMIAIKRPISSELSKVIGFFQYAGLLSPNGISNRGGKGVYEIYEMHFAAIIDRNVFFSRRAIHIENYVQAFRNRPNHHYPRHTEQSILDSDNPSELFTLALPPCEICKSPRMSDAAKFCSACGSRLKDVSIFENIVGQDIKNLPITHNRASTIKINSKIKTIKDILMDHENRELRSVAQIGPIWARRIRNYAQEFIA